MIRVLYIGYIGEVLWQGKEKYKTVAVAVDEAEAFIARWQEEQ